MTTMETLELRSVYGSPIRLESGIDSDRTVVLDIVGPNRYRTLDKQLAKQIGEWLVEFGDSPDPVVPPQVGEYVKNEDWSSIYRVTGYFQNRVQLVKSNGFTISVSFADIGDLKVVPKPDDWPTE